MNVKVSPLIGIKSLRAFNVFHTLLIGLKMTPLYIAETYDVFFERFEKMDDKQKEKTLRDACLFVPLDADEVDALTQFCTDANGVALTSINTGRMSPADLIDVIVAVCMEIAKIKVFMGTEDSKKKL